MMKCFSQFIWITITFLSLQGCFSTALSGASAVYDRYNIQEKAKNQEISVEVNQAIKNDPVFQGSDIKITCFNYQVLLTGETSSEILRKKAAMIAANTHDVKHVYNFIEKGDVNTTEEDLYDTWLTTKIKSQIIAEAKMDPNQIKVVTEKKVVYLMGHLTKTQAKYAIDIARYTPGVKQVVIIFKYIHFSFA